MLGGFYEPGSALSALVPAGKLAIDAGANVGTYSYWIARSATRVVAFEPQPTLARRLEASGIPRLTVHNVALSDTPGVGELHVPRAHGEASLRVLDVPVDAVKVPLRTLDSFEMSDVGFFKIDVEGHEEPLLHGAVETLRRSDATVYIEIEERHNPGGLERIVSWFGELGYTDVQFRQNAKMHPYRDFHLERDQLHQSPRTPAYANNFLFRRGRD
ncbi:FkbM family methyltransferase [Mycobacterium sp. M26]|uniref:FkbM family methyltransferase n=1 Tax=Mycobacterium sp. M26 TaxID=1762962 RepID=UPI0009EB36BC|nr:FkbM family methyltransferase [Mycobacterium sp. M26]